jgi:hypothetical protein
VHTSTIKAWHHADPLLSHKANNKNERLYELPMPGDPRLVKRMGSKLARRVLIDRHGRCSLMPTPVVDPPPTTGGMLPTFFISTCTRSPGWAIS